MRLKISVQICMKLIIIVLLVWYLPTYTTQSAKVFKALETTSVSEPVSQVTHDKKVHIYNTHQGEQYNGYNVVEAAKYLKDCLTNDGYYCDFEENDFENYKSVHKISYNNSYVVSKMYLENAISTTGPYDIVIDFHRDSIPKSLSTITVNGKSYAKIMFVVGQSSGKFEAVNSLSQDLSNRANSYVEGISRGIMQKKSHYNQGICDNTILIEFGAQDNTKEEVMATVEVLCHVLEDYLQ